MEIRRHVRTIALGSMLALSVMSLPAVEVHAMSSGPTGGAVGCSNKEVGGSAGTTAVGQDYVDSTGQKFHCTPNGWLMVPLLAPQGPMAPLHPITPLPVTDALG